MTITAAEVRDIEFARASRFTRGYSSREVDAFVEAVAERLESGSGISSNDVYHQTFSKPPLADRGYAEQAVDAFLDRVHAELVLLEDAWGHTSEAGPDDTAETDTADTPIGAVAAEDPADSTPDTRRQVD